MAGEDLLINGLKHRFSLIEKSNLELEKNSLIIDQKISQNQIKFKDELVSLRAELISVEEEINKLMKFVFSHGKILKDKMRKEELALLNELSEKFNFEDYIRRDELEKTFKKYA
jgi:hypothetical protein